MTLEQISALGGKLTLFLALFAGAGQGSLWNFGVFDIGGVKYKSGQVAAVGFAVDLGL